MKIKEFICVVFLALQLRIAFHYILALTPLSGGMVILNDEVWLYVYIILGIVGIAIKFLTKVRFNWVVYGAYGITILYGIFFLLILHAAYYNNQGDICIDPNFIDINPITYYNDKGKYPPRIDTLYGLFAFNILAMLLIYFFDKWKRVQ